MRLLQPVLVVETVPFKVLFLHLQMPELQPVFAVGTQRFKGPERGVERHRLYFVQSLMLFHYNTQIQNSIQCHRHIQHAQRCPKETPALRE